MSTVVEGPPSKVGQDPASAVYVGPARTGAVHITVFDYDADGVAERDSAAIEHCVRAARTDARTWINVDGIHDADLVAELGEKLHVHPLVIEDILDTSQRPKVDEAAEYLYIVLRSLTWDAEASVVRSEQVSLVLGPCFLLSFEEQPGPIFDAVKERLRSGRSHLREQGSDFLAHALVDAVVDQYFGVLEAISDRVETLQDGLLSDPGPDDLGHIHSLKRCLAYVRQSVWPLREAINILTRGENELLSDKVNPYFRDVYDNAISVIDNVEVQREVVSGALELYLSSVSNRLNETMKVLTVITAIFVPLTFVAGVYGMNFEHMPELGWKWGYAICLALMATVAFLQIRWFRRKGWI